jgi:hypothetical protein
MTFWDDKSLHDHSHLEQLTAAQGSVAKTLAGKIGYDGKYQTSADRLATLAGVNKRTVLGAVRRLEALGIVSLDVAGRRSATAYTWHSCPSDCVNDKHTGKKDTRRSRYLFGQLPEPTEATAEAKPKGKAARRRESKQNVMASLSGAVAQSSGALSHNLSGALSGSSGAPSALPKDVSQSQNRLNTKKPLVTHNLSGALSPWINTDEALLASETLHRQAEEYSASPQGAYADVLWQLLDDENHHHHLTAFAAEYFAAPVIGDSVTPARFTDDDHLRRFVIVYARFAGLSSSLFDVVNQYRAWPGKSEPWHHLSRLVRMKLIAGQATLDQFTDDALKMSPVVPAMKETAPQVTYGSTFPPHDEQVADLISKLSAITSE